MYLRHNIFIKYYGGIKMNQNTGRIIFASGNLYKAESGGVEHICALSGKFSKNHSYLPAVGDYVTFIKSGPGTGLIEEISERKSVISRKASGRVFEENVLAANVDILLIVSPADRSFSIKRIERFLVLAFSGGVRPVVILSKADACSPIDTAVCTAELEESLPDVLYIQTSTVTGEGYDELCGLLSEGVTVCAAGLSGSGKSSLLNWLRGEQTADTGEVREKDSRGRHTTTARHLFRLPSGAFFIDTPGIREVGVTDDADSVNEVFSEITSASADCLFSDCSHTVEPGCSVLEKVYSGEIKRERYDNYLKLLKESESYQIRSVEKNRRKSEKKLSKMVKSVNKYKKRF